MPANLAEWIGSPYQSPIARVVIADQTAKRVTSVEVELGYASQSSQASVTVVSPTIPTWKPSQPVLIQLGYGGTNGGLQTVFTGEVEEVDLSFFPHRVEVRCAGYLRRLQPPYRVGFAYSNIDDGAVWEELMRKSGVPRYATGPTVSEAIVYGGRKPIEVEAGASPRDLVDKLDQSSPGGMRTYEMAGIVMRSRVLGIPSANVAVRYAEGAAVFPVLRVLEVRRLDSVRDLQNAVKVTGLPDGDTEVFAERRADSPYVPNDLDGYMRDQAYSFSSDIVESRDHCDQLCQRYLSEKNRRSDAVNLRVPLNPFLFPGQSLGLTAPKVGLGTERPYWVRQVRHTYGARGAWSEVEAEGGAGDTGYLIGLDPIAAFTYTVSAEAFLVDGEPQMLYTVVADGSTSVDPDGTIAEYGWEASNGATGTGVVFTVAFTAEQWAPEDPEAEGPTLTLHVTDADTDPTGPHTASHTERLSGEATPLISRTIYVAASGQADCTPDGGLSWNTWTPPAGQVISTPEVAPLDHSYFGLSDGKLYRTDDALFSEPTLVHDFPGRVECIWVNEANSVRVWVGLHTGAIWYTVQADLREEAVWLQAVDLPDPVNWLVESYAAEGQVRACSGTNVYITHNAFGEYGVLSSLPDGECKRLALSFFGNYASGASSAPVVHEDSSPVGFPGAPPADVRITAFADRDALLAVDEAGQSWVKGEGAAGFVAAGGTGFGACGHVVRDGEQTAVFYAACAEGLAKSYDRAATWRPLRDYAGPELVGLQVGYGAAPMLPPVRLAFVERAPNQFAVGAQPEFDRGIAGNGTVRASLCTDEGSPLIQDPPPPGWTDAGFDDSVPWTTRSTPHPWAEETTAIIFGSNQRFFRAWDSWAQDSNPTHTQEQALFRHVFTLPPAPAGTGWLTALLETYNLQGGGAEGNQHTAPFEVYVNGHGVPCSAEAMFQYIPAAWLVADGTTENCIAVRAGYGGASLLSGHRACWKLTLSNHDTVVSLSTGLDGALYWRPTGECKWTPIPPDESVPPGWNQDAEPGEIPAVSRYRAFNANEFGPIFGISDPRFGYVGTPGWTVGLQNTVANQATFRHPIPLPVSSSGGPYQSVELQIKWYLGEATLRGCWFNGQAVAVPSPGAYELDPTILIPGTWNVFCALLQSADDPSWIPDLSYLIRIVP